MVEWEQLFGTVHQSGAETARLATDRSYAEICGLHGIIRCVVQSVWMQVEVENLGRNGQKNKMQLKYSGKLMRHWYWSILLMMLLLILTAVVLYINTLAGVIVGGFTVVLYVTVLGMDLYYRPRVLTELMDFSRKYGAIEQDILKEISFPFCLVQPDGKILRMNDQMAALTGKQEDYIRILRCCFRI